MTSIIKVNNLQNQCGANTINKCGTAITVGASGDTVTLAAGASQSGFGQTYSAVSWDTTPKTGLFTAVSGVGYFCNTTSAPFTVTLPAGTAGDVIAFADYTRTFQTNNLTITPNGSEKIGGVASNFVAQTEGQSITLVYVDATEGWINTAESTGQSGLLPAFITATGGTITTVCTDYKVHTFTGPGTLCVSCAGNPLGSSAVDYMVIAGGGGGGSGGGAGGAGGYRESSGTASGSYTASPLGACVSALPVTVTGYPITIGGGGGPGPTSTPGVTGSNSIFSTITSAGGGGGGENAQNGLTGGSGGGGAWEGGLLGAGNTPPVSPPQGQPGGNTGPSPSQSSGGGGGATTVGATGCESVGGTGGTGATNSINATPTGRAGGGGGGGSNSATAGTTTCGGGAGGEGVGPGGPGAGTSGTTNSGGGAGGGGIGGCGNGIGGSGGSGIVIIRYKFQ